MNKLSRFAILAVTVITVAVIIAWQATGGDWYTKYEVVEQVDAVADPDDPLVAAGFYDGGTTSTTVTRDEFRLGLLPTPSGLIDKHVISVATVTGPVWAFGLVFLWYQRRRVRLSRSLG